ncbi:MAG: hypothetical protein WCK74_02760 [Gemmatimonadaceae bacterium]
MTEAAEAPGRPAILLHGGSPDRRADVAAALLGRWGDGLRVHRSSRAAEAAKWLVDPAVVGVVLIDAPPDAAAVRLAAAQRADRWVNAVDAPWTAEMVLDAVSDRL